MFDFSFFELLVVGAVALVVIGPEKLPQVARTVGKWVGKVQRYVADVKRDINREVEFEELRKLRAEMNETARSVEATARSMESSLRQQQVPEPSLDPTASTESEPLADGAASRVAAVDPASEQEQAPSAAPDAHEAGAKTAPEAAPAVKAEPGEPQGQAVPAQDPPLTTRAQP